MNEIPVLGIGEKIDDVGFEIGECRWIHGDEIDVKGKQPDQQVIKRKYPQDPAHIEFPEIAGIFFGLDQNPGDQ